MKGFDPDLLSSRILLLESDSSLRKCIDLTLRPFGVELFEASDAQTALKIIQDRSLDLFLLGLSPADPETGDVMDAFRKKMPERHSYIVLMTVQRPDDRWRQRYLPDQVLYKPIDVRFLYRRIKALLKRAEVYPMG